MYLRHKLTVVTWELFGVQNKYKTDEKTKTKINNRYCYPRFCMQLFKFEEKQLVANFIIA